MRGLRKQEDKKFENFFEIVQKKAKKKGCIFFLESEEGHEFESEHLEGSDLFGWLIPSELADSFEQHWRQNDLEDFGDYGKWVIWYGSTKSPQIKFEDF